MDWYRQQLLNLEELEQVRSMMSPVRCTVCSLIYDLGKVEVIGRYADCSVWKCPRCKVTCDDRPVSWGDHHYVELR